MRQSVFIATPTYDEWVCMEYSTSLFETGTYLAHAGICAYHSVAPGNPFLDLARNALVDKFLETDATDLLFVDADVGWDAHCVTRILSYPQLVVGGLVPKRDAKRDDSYHQNAITGVISPEGLFQSLELPTAFMRVRREAFEKLKAVGYGSDERPFFKIGAKKSEFGEDIYFNRRIADIGEHCWIDSDISFSHRGGRAWRGNFYDHCIKSGALTVSKVA